MAQILLDDCPLCNSTTLLPFLQCTDYTSTQEPFNLVRCQKCDFIFTNPRPDDQALPKYYQSDEYISHTGKTKGIIGILYLQARKFTLRWKLKTVTKFKQPSSILDYGCGTGEVLSVFHQNGWKISGVEPNQTARTIASKNTGTKIASTLSDLDENAFDVISLWHVLEHVTDLKPKLNQLKSLLKTDGILIVAVPNHESLDAAHYGEFWAAYDVPRHLWHFSSSTITRLAESEGLRVHQILPMKLDSYYVSLLSEKYQNPDGNALTQLILAFINGFRSNLAAQKSGNYSSLIYIIRQ